MEQYGPGTIQDSSLNASMPEEKSLALCAMIVVIRITKEGNNAKVSV